MKSYDGDMLLATTTTKIPKKQLENFLPTKMWYKVEGDFMKADIMLLKKSIINNAMTIVADTIIDVRKTVLTHGFLLQYSPVIKLLLGKYPEYAGNIVREMTDLEETKQTLVEGKSKEIGLKYNSFDAGENKTKTLGKELLAINACNEKKKDISQILAKISGCGKNVRSETEIKEMRNFRLNVIREELRGVKGNYRKAAEILYSVFPGT